MDNNAGVYINDSNNVNGNDIEPNDSSSVDNTEQVTTDELQYEHLKELNQKLTLFKKDKQFEKNE